MNELDSFLAGLKRPDRTIKDTAFWDDFRALLDTWPSSMRSEMHALLEGYAGYPLYDAVVFPIEALSNIRQSNLIQADRISPEIDVLTITRPKLKGTGLRNFAAFLRKTGVKTTFSGDASTARQSCSS
ncbi:hypothetical protein OOZ51_12770 [Arthrobacter sp. MI7-26]|nr:hypothetical protein [Arthrobacter sp. MI7-26]MCX2748679.1 hypothetical protein [Arthrobacter sp. MI7-26]